MRKALKLFALGGVLLAAAAAAWAQERSPADRQTLVELAYALGQSHALRQVCSGANDYYWRRRMQQLVAAEQPDGPFNRRLADSFNDGFIASRQAFPVCNAASRAEAEAIAAKGGELAQDLNSGAVAEDGPTR
ncbi:MAG TPA: TIGR02301 family protein [Caulobacteraceae bacterium]|nr:TIGR02301 family protein [Caulobacteraceae bacterium]